MTINAEEMRPDEWVARSPSGADYDRLVTCLREIRAEYSSLLDSKNLAVSLAGSYAERMEIQVRFDAMRRKLALIDDALSPFQDDASMHLLRVPDEMEQE